MNRKIVTELSDGRELIYFDDSSTTLPESRRGDMREASERPEPAQMRLDSLTGEWISIASHRNGRAFLPPAHLCPLCPASESNLSEIPDNFDVAVFENKSPSFGPTVLLKDDPFYAELAENPLGATREAIGRCEVVVFSAEHLGSLSAMPIERVRTVIEAWADRTDFLQTLPGVRQVFPFENRGEEIGVTLHHPHGQIYAYPYVTPRTKKLLESLRRFGPSLFEETLQFEKSSDRVLIASENFTAYVPFAARWPIEVHLLPNRSVADFTDLTDDEKDELAGVYSRILGAVDRLYETPTPYISAWHQAPLVPAGADVRLQLQITSPRRATDKLKYLAGSESAMGAFIGDIAPEFVAGQLRDLL